MLENTALIVVDMQRYYIDPEGDFFKYSESRYPGGMNYIAERCSKTVIPNIMLLLDLYRKTSNKIIYLCLCGTKEDRSDLHRFFKKSQDEGSGSGFNNIYPLKSDKFAKVLKEIKPVKKEKIFYKTTFSAFNSTNIKKYLIKNNIKTLIFTGLATSQCVETTARDASDHGFTVIHIEDAQADYTEKKHIMSLMTSAAVCGSWITETKPFIAEYDEFLKTVYSEEKI